MHAAISGGRSSGDFNCQAGKKTVAAGQGVVVQAMDTGGGELGQQRSSDETKDMAWILVGSETTKLFDLILSSHKTDASPGHHSMAGSVSRVKQTAKRLTMQKERGRKLSLYKDPARGRPSWGGGWSTWAHTGSVVLIGILSCSTMLLTQQALDRGTQAAGSTDQELSSTRPF